MNIQLKNIKDEGSFLIVEYEGSHSTGPPRGTTLTFEMELVVYKFPGGDTKPVHVKKVTGFEHLEADSIPEIFSEIARIAKRIVATLEHCKQPGVSLPIMMDREKISENDLTSD
jgi:hypothetical protein